MRLAFTGSALAVILILFPARSPAEVQWVQSSPAAYWEVKTAALSDAPDEPADVTVLPGEHLQVVDGFGACFNELGWTALSLLEDEQRKEILEQLFDPGKGLRLNICRMPVGANDYARNYYSLNDSAGDFSMKYFSMDRDREMLIPYIKAALQCRPDLRIWGSPWTPPSWMKTNRHYACRPDANNDMTPDQGGREGVTQFRMETPYLEAYARYLVKYVLEYAKEGIRISGIHVQNEMNSCQNFPSCIWTATDLGIFIGNYLGPAIKKEIPETELWYGTYERPYVEKIDTILQDPRVSRYIAGISFQWAGKQAIPGVRAKYPGIKLMQSETECGDGSNDWKAAEYTFSLMKHYFDNGISVYTFWNSVLDETGKSRWGWKQNSMITVDSQTRTVTCNPEFYLLKHFSHFIDPGAVMMATSGSNDQVLAFRNPGGELIIIAGNSSDRSVQTSIGIDNKILKVSLVPNSFNTFIVQPPCQGTTLTGWYPDRVSYIPGTVKANGVQEPAGK